MTITDVPAASTGTARSARSTRSTRGRRRTSRPRSPQAIDTLEHAGSLAMAAAEYAEEALGEIDRTLRFLQRRLEVNRAREARRHRCPACGHRTTRNGS
jgi:hypothetical protein